MTQILVIESEDIIITALKKAFENDNEIKLHFADNFIIGTEILNGNQKNKSIYENHRAVYESVKEEFLEATRSEVSAKTISMNCSDLLEKYKNELQALSQEVTSQSNQKVEEPVVETPEEQSIKKQGLNQEIQRLELELKKHNEDLNKATKYKIEKEKISLEKQKTAEEAKSQIPSVTEEHFSVLLISSKFVLPNVTSWCENFKKTITYETNKDIKIIILGFEFDEKNIRKFLNPRISDYMIKPIDDLLARQNIKFLAMADKKPKREVYSLKIEESIDLVFEFELEGLSENSFFINSKEEFKTNEFRVFSSDIFLRKEQRAVLAKCLSSTKKSNDQFSSEFWIMGMDAHLAFQIKNVIKNYSKN